MKKIIKLLGVLIFLTGFVIFLLALREQRFTLMPHVVESVIVNPYHKQLIKSVDYEMLEEQYESSEAFVNRLERLFRDVKIVEGLKTKNTSSEIQTTRVCEL